MPDPVGRDWARTRAPALVVAASLAGPRARDRRRALAASRGPLAGAGGGRGVGGRGHASGARRVQGGEPAGAVHGAAAAGAGAGPHHARSSDRTRAPRCLAGPAVCDAHVEEAARLQPRRRPDAGPRDRRDDGHLQRGQRSGDQAPSLSRIRERRDRWRLGSIWKPAYARLPAGAPDVRFVRGERPIVPGVRSVHCVRGDGDRVGESGTHEHVAGDARDPDGPGRSTRARPMVLARRPSAGHRRTRRS